MAKGYLAGVMLGLVVSVGAAVGLSLLAGGPVLRDTAPEVATTDASGGVQTIAVPDDSPANLPGNETRPETGEAPKVAGTQPEEPTPVPETMTAAKAPEVATATATIETPSETADRAPKVAAAAGGDAPMTVASEAPAPAVPASEADAEIVAAEPVARPQAGSEPPQAPSVQATRIARPEAPASVSAPRTTNTAPAAIVRPEPGTDSPVAPTAGAAPEPAVQASAPAAMANPDTAVEVGAAPAVATAQPVEIVTAPDSPTAPAGDSPIRAGTVPAVKSTPTPEPAPQVATPMTDPAAGPEPEPQPMAEAEPAPEAPLPVEPPRGAVVLPKVAAEAESTPSIRIGKPAAGFKTLGTGVQTGRLASIGQQEQGALPGKRVKALPGNATAVETPAAAVPATTAPSSDLPPVQRFAAPFQDPGNKPKMAIVLIDATDQPVGIEALSSFPYPLSFAIDTSRPDATDRMAIYRAAGFEVLAMVALPQGATPADVEVSLPVLMAKVPEAVAVMETPGGGIQFDRKVSDQVTRFLADTGHGLLLFPKGLNTAEKLAVKNGVPASVIFRDIDGKGQKTSAIRRFLNYGALNADNEGGVVLVGRLQPDTVTALLLWGLEDRAQQIALAPVSRLLIPGP